MSTLPQLDASATSTAGFSVSIRKVTDELGVTDRGYRIVTNVGDDAGQTQHHLHFHAIGGRKLGLEG